MREPEGIERASGISLEALDAKIREGLGDLRASLWCLDPEQGSWEALIARIRRHGSDLCTAAGVAFTMEAEGDRTGEMSAAARLALIRVTQEAVSNALKHGAPQRVEIRVSVGRSMVDVVVEDDGLGLPADLPAGRGLGNMARRIEGLGGVFRIERAEPHGARVVFAIPEGSVHSAPSELDPTAP